MQKLETPETLAQFKTLPQFVKGIEGRQVTGICAVFGNIDLGRDRLWPGAFTKTIAERSPRIKHLWNHGQDGWDYFCTPPIAAIKALREVTRDQLPEAVLAVAPEAVGGLEVTREYLETERGGEVFENLKAGVGLEMSFGYDAIKYEYTTVYEGTPQEIRVRELREVRLWDTSDVNWGMNPATSAAGKNVDFIGRLVKRCQMAIEEYRSGKLEFAGHLLELRALLAGVHLTAEEQQQQPAPIPEPIAAPAAAPEPEQPEAEPASRADQPPISFDWRSSLTANLDQLRELEQLAR